VKAKTGEVAIIIVAIKAKAVLIGKSSSRVEGKIKRESYSFSSPSFGERATSDLELSNACHTLLGK
jgi:hypothetical protein